MPSGIFNGYALNKNAYHQVHLRQKKTGTGLQLSSRIAFVTLTLLSKAIYSNLSNHDSSVCELSSFSFLRILKPGCIFKKTLQHRGTISFYHYPSVFWKNNFQLIAIEQLNFLWQLIKPLQLCTLIFLKLDSWIIVYKGLHLSAI